MTTRIFKIGYMCLAIFSKSFLLLAGCAGAAIGKAMGSLEKGEGKIEAVMLG